MKTIGIIGGISWVSSADYYRLINEQINQQLGGVNAGKIILYSVNYGDIKALTEQGDWPAITAMICKAATILQQAGADCLLVGANTMHRIADDIRAAVNIPLIHIADITGKEIAKKQLTTVALLGTKFTMELDFYHAELQKHGIATIIPDEADRDFIHTTIYEELGRGVLLPATKARYLQVIEKLVAKGAEGIILGCTEIPLLIQQADCTVPVFDTTLIHATAAVEFALKTEAVSS